MCGIMAYIGKRNTSSVLIDGLTKLEYRGYDSAGLILNDREFSRKRSVGRVSSLAAKIEPDLLLTNVGVGGIAHTRWATHGGVTEENAHPHNDFMDEVCVVHNGIIDNADQIKEMLESKYGRKFDSQTDTECVAQLLGDIYSDLLNPTETVKAALKLLKGTYGLAIVFRSHTDSIWVARNGSPLVVGLGEGENFAASDPLALVKYTNRVVYLDDGECAEISKKEVKFFTLEGHAPSSSETLLDSTYSDIESLGSHDSYMVKEIREQPESIKRCFGGRVRQDAGECKLGGLGMSSRDMAQIKSVTFLGCGTSYHAGMIGAHLVEKMARIPARVEMASEFVSRNPLIDIDGIYLAISQSGETYDTMECVKEIQNRGARTYGVVNVVGSSIARLCGSGIYIHAGPEIAVASTKAFTSQVSALCMLSVALARNRGMVINDGRLACKDLKEIPDLIAANLDYFDGQAKKLAERLAPARNALYIGRGLSYPVALEGALKLKEIAYIPCDAYAAGEMKHGPIAMIEEGTPVVAICPEDEYLSATHSNIKEVMARGAKVIVIANRKIVDEADHIIVPKTNSLFSPLLTSIPLQLLAYHSAKLLGKDVDKPRNLAKSVCVG